MVSRQRRCFSGRPRRGGGCAAVARRRRPRRASRPPSPPRRRGSLSAAFPLSSSPSETGSAFGARRLASHGSSAAVPPAPRRPRRARARGGRVRSRAVDGGVESSVRQGSSVKVSALRLGSPGAGRRRPRTRPRAVTRTANTRRRRSRARPPRPAAWRAVCRRARRARDARAEAAAAPRVPDEAGRAIGLRRV